MAKKSLTTNLELLAIDRSSDQTQDTQLYQQIFDAILAQRLLPGTKLTEDELADIFGLSRTVVRRALLRLSHDRIVDLRPNKGASVASLSIQQAKEVLRARRLIESAIIREVVSKITQDQINNLRSLVSREQSQFEHNEKGSGLRLSGEFHLELAKFSGNETLIKFIGELIPRTSLLIAQYEKLGHGLCSHQEHFEIIDIIAAGEAESAATLMDEHLQHIEDKLDFSEESASDNLRVVFAHICPSTTNTET